MHSMFILNRTRLMTGVANNNNNSNNNNNVKARPSLTPDRSRPKLPRHLMCTISHYPRAGRCVGVTQQLRRKPTRKREMPLFDVNGRCVARVLTEGLRVTWRCWHGRERGVKCVDTKSPPEWRRSGQPMTTTSRTSVLARLSGVWVYNGVAHKHTAGRKCSRPFRHRIRSERGDVVRFFIVQSHHSASSSSSHILCTP